MWTGSSLESTDCKFLIWAAPMKEILRVKIFERKAVSMIFILRSATDSTKQEWSLLKSHSRDIFCQSGQCKKCIQKCTMKGIQHPELLGDVEEYHSCLQLAQNKTSEMEVQTKLRLATK